MGWAAGRNLQLRSYVASFTLRVCRPKQRVCSGADLLLPSSPVTQCFLHHCITCAPGMLPEALSACDLQALLIARTLTMCPL